MKKIKHKYGHAVGDFFGKYKKRCGIVAPPKKKTLNSFRHTVADHLTKNDVPEHVVAMLIGHKNKNITTNRYAKRFEPAMLLEKAVMKLNYDIDLSHLKNSKYVVK